MDMLFVFTTEDGVIQEWDYDLVRSFIKDNDNMWDTLSFVGTGFFVHLDQVVGNI